MTAFRVLAAMTIGLAFGSFLTVVVHRVPAGESIVRPRSRCPTCGTPLRGVDNIPVVSWILLRGRCHACGARISAVYPLTELATGGLFVAAALAFEDPWLSVMIAFFLGVLLSLSIIDLRTKRLPNAIVYPALVAFPCYLVVAGLAGADVDLLDALIGFLAYGGGLLVIALVAPKGMGMGDVKLAALIGVVLGSLGLEFVAVAAGAGILLGGVGAIAALIGGASRKQGIPFGPFLAGGALIATFWGQQIADAYLRLLT